MLNSLKYTMNSQGYFPYSKHVRWKYGCFAIHPHLMTNPHPKYFRKLEERLRRKQDSVHSLILCLCKCAVGPTNETFQQIGAHAKANCKIFALFGQCGNERDKYAMWLLQSLNGNIYDRVYALILFKHQTVQRTQLCLFCIIARCGGEFGVTTTASTNTEEGAKFTVLKIIIVYVHGNGNILGSPADGKVSVIPQWFRIV